MSHRVPFACAAVLAACCVATAAFAVPQPTCDPPAQGVPLKWCPPVQLVTVTFNPALDPALETTFGNAAMRTAAFQQAIADWNTALAGVGATLRLAGAIGPNAWATDQNAAVCTEPLPPLPSVYGDTRAAYFPDAMNEASTGRNPNNAHLDMLGQPLGPGWIIPIGVTVPDTMGGVLQIESALAVTALQIDPQNAGCLTEADIAWYTHTPYLPPVGGVQCIRTSWDYSYPAGPAATRFDFYSVMLHELGHVLGIEHQADDGTGKNVMQAYISKGQRRMIGAKELMCLCERYGPPTANCAQVTPVHRSTWGQLKSVYH